MWCDSVRLHLGRDGQGVASSRFVNGNSYSRRRAMHEHEISRRAMLKGSAALAALVALGFPLEALEVEAAAGEEVVPWLDQPPPFPGPPEQVATQLVWEELGSQLTWNEKFF